jgi:hypothetical protein
MSTNKLQNPIPNNIPYKKRVTTEWNQSNENDEYTDSDAVDPSTSSFFDSEVGSKKKRDKSAKQKKTKQALA